MHPYFQNMFSICIALAYVPSILINHQLFPYYARVIQPVIDVVAHEGIVYQRAAPTAPYHTPEILAQLIYNERIIVDDTKGSFSKVTIPSQTIIKNNKREPITGWVESSALQQEPSTSQGEPLQQLVCIVPWTAVYREDPKNRYSYTFIMTIPFCTKLTFLEHNNSWTRVVLADGSHACVPSSAVAILNEEERSLPNIRQSIIQRARQFIGMPYCWGGMSPHQPAWSNKLSGFDCSGLIERCCESCGIAVPRNSRSQYYAAQPRNPIHLQAADVVFLAREKITPTNNTVFHVLFYTGDDSLIESWTKHEVPDYDTQPLREVSVTERLGKPIKLLHQGERCPQGYYCYFGNLLHSGKIKNTNNNK